jgi:hypothetical protein
LAADPTCDMRRFGAETGPRLRGDFVAAVYNSLMADRRASERRLNNVRANKSTWLKASSLALLSA